MTVSLKFEVVFHTYCFSLSDSTAAQQELEKAEKTAAHIINLLAALGSDANATVLRHVNGLLDNVVVSLSTAAKEEKQPCTSSFATKEHFRTGQANPIQIKGFYPVKKVPGPPETNCLQ